MPPPRNAAFLSWTILDQSSSSFLLPAALQVLERKAICGAFKLDKVEFLGVEFEAASMNPAELNSPIPPRQTVFARVRDY